RLHERDEHRAPPDRDRRGARSRADCGAGGRRPRPSAARRARPARDVRGVLLQLLRHHLARAHEQLHLLRRLLVADGGPDGRADGVPRAARRVHPADRAGRLPLLLRRWPAAHVARLLGAPRRALALPLRCALRRVAPRGPGANDAAHVTVQRRWALEELGYPVWGLSPSSTPGTDGYGEYGVRVLGSLGYGAGAVTPHAVALALGVAPAEAASELRQLA